MEGRMLDVNATTGHCTLLTVTVKNYNGSVSSRGAEQRLCDWVGWIEGGMKVSFEG